MYEYQATMVRWVDGDTCDVTVDLGFRIYHQMRLRLIGIDTPERGQPGYREATEFAAAIAPPGTGMLIRTYMDASDKYGRYLAQVWEWANPGVPVVTKSVNDQLLDRKLAVPYEP